MDLGGKDHEALTESTVYSVSAVAERIKSVILQLFFYKEL